MSLRAIVGKKYRHLRSGRIYEVLLIANEHATYTDDWPIIVSYRRLDDQTIWARRYDSWNASFEEVEDAIGNSNT
jgi:hypothetical protein